MIDSSLRRIVQDAPVIAGLPILPPHARGGATDLNNVPVQADPAMVFGPISPGYIGLQREQAGK